MTPNPVELALIDRWQRGFPLVERPFAEAGRDFGFDEGATLATFRRLRDAGVIARIGAVVKPHTVGASTLAAMRVPDARLDEVAAIVSRQPAVNHNYQRTHAFNLWFVVAGPDHITVTDTLRRIEEECGLAVLDLPLVRAFHVDLGFSLTRAAGRDEIPRSAGPDYRADRLDRSLLAAIEEGLAIVPRPYDDIADRLGVDADDVRGRLRQLVDAGVIGRFGCVVNHRALGYRANAMAVWDIADDSVDADGQRLSRHPKVSLCYRRPRRLPEWPYNLFCMVHAKRQDKALEVVDELNRTLEGAARGHAVLFSTRCFKQRGATFSRPSGGVH
jgi:DNA-binding Lrp family transcriptional regulator